MRGFIGILCWVLAVLPADTAGRQDARAAEALVEYFAFRFEHDCPGETIDTFTGTFTRAMAGGPRSIAFKVSPDLLRNVQAAVRAADFFSYPAVFKSPPLDFMRFPTLTYVLDVRSGGQRHRVSWTDETGSGGASDV